MAVLFDRVPENRLIKTPTFYPLPMTGDKLHNSAIYLLTPSLDDSIDFLKNTNVFVNNRTYLSYYIEKSFDFIIQESTNEDIDRAVQIVLESANGESDIEMNDRYMNIDGTKIFYPDAVDDIIFREDYGINNNYSNTFKRFLYEKRIVNQKEMLDIYDKIKDKLPIIKYTYLNLDLYRKKNLILDWAYYTQTFLSKIGIYRRDKAIDLFHHFICRFINDTRIIDLGYNRAAVFVPVQPWADLVKKGGGKDIWDFNGSPNPFNMIYRLIYTSKNLGQYLGDIPFVFCSDKAYFKLKLNTFSKVDLPKFKLFTSKLIENDIIDIVNNLISDDKEDTDTNDEIYDTSTTEKKSVKQSKPVSKKIEAPKRVEVKEEKPEEKESEDDKKWVADVMSTLQNTGTSKMTDSRKARMNELNERFNNSEINGKSVKKVMDTYYTRREELDSVSLPVDSIDDQWKDVKYLSFNSKYDLTDDIIAILQSLSNKTNPISIISVDKEDTSTYEDYIETYTIKVEDMYGTRSTIKLDMPKFINNRFMKLRGNVKTINGQLILLPIIKTDQDTVQIVSSYNKIFISRVSPANGIKISAGINKLYKAIKKYDGDDITVFEGNNELKSSLYVLPAEYKDIGNILASIKLKDGSYISFDPHAMEELDKKYGKPSDKEMTVGFDTKTNKPVRVAVNNVGYGIGDYLSSKSPKFKEIYDNSKPSDKLAYSEASILNIKIPVIVVMAYSEGLQKAMDKAKIKYRFSDKRVKKSENEAILKFSDGYLIYDITEEADSLLMSGLAQSDLSDYSIKDINTKTMWLDILEEYGSRLKADGLDNFYDCMFDPMTIDICKRYNLPYDYVTALGYASSLLGDTKYNKHTDITGNRVRTNELVAGYLYKALTRAYGDYSNKVKRAGKGTKFTIKQTAVIDDIMLDPGFSDLSILNPLLEAESNNTLSFKGLSGMNSDRSYNLDKRVYDKSMLGVIAMSTGFAGNVGITRQASINSSITDMRGDIAPKKESELNTLNTLSVYEGVAPFSTTHDDGMRVAMGFIQTNKHQMRVVNSSPNLISYGVDEALPYMTSNVFSYKFKGKSGKVLVANDDHIIYEAIDDKGKKTNHFISLKDTVMKNSDGGFFILVKLDPMVKKGDILHNNDILAYDKTSYSKSIASEKNKKNISYNIGTMAKIGIMCTDEAYEDSSIIDQRLSESLASVYCVQKSRSLSADTNVYSIVNKGDDIQEGSPLMILESSFDDKSANILLQNLNDDEIDIATDFGRIEMRSKITGKVQDIKIYRTCELNELSPSLRKIVSKYEKEIKEQKALFAKYKIPNDEAMDTIEPDYKLEATGKLKNVENGVLIEFYISAYDKMSIGDKLTYNTAIKGTIKDIIPKGDEPYTEFRPKEPVDALLTSASVNARMAVSIITSGAINKVLIELGRKCKETLGLDWNNIK